MPVKIKDKGYLSGFRQLIEIFFYVASFMQIFVPVATIPSSIEIVAKKIGPVVSGHNSIRVDHWDYFNLIVFS